MKPGDTIGKYRLVNRLGHGGMGEVWLAQASGYGGFSKAVVLKTLLPEYENDQLYIDMLAHEARTCGKLHHPNLIEVFDFSKHGRVHLLAMEHVDGASLAEILRAVAGKGWAIPAWFALRVAWECARGLDCAHDLGVIHCDLSPSNVMITYAGVTKILDFGVAHSNTDGEKPDRLKGKFSYMAPERFRELATDRRTDVYALGVMLYLLLCGKLPFVAQSDLELVRLKQVRPISPSEHAQLDPALERVIMRSLEPDPDARYQTAGELLQALTPCLAGQLGTYGQLDAAAYVSALFDEDRESRAVTTRALAAMADGTGDSESAVEVDVDIVFDDGGNAADYDSEGDGDIERSSVIEALPDPPILPAMRAETVYARPSGRIDRPEETRVQQLFGSGGSSPPTTRREDAWAWPWAKSRKSD